MKDLVSLRGEHLKSVCCIICLQLRHQLFQWRWDFTFFNVIMPQCKHILIKLLPCITLWSYVLMLRTMGIYFIWQNAGSFPIQIWSVIFITWCILQDACFSSVIFTLLYIYHIISMLDMQSQYINSFVSFIIFFITLYFAIFINFNLSATLFLYICNEVKTNNTEAF